MFLFSEKMSFCKIDTKYVGPNEKIQVVVRAEKKLAQKFQKLSIIVQSKLCMKAMVVGLSSFQTGGTKSKRFLPKNQHTQRKLLNFDNWCNGEVSKSAKI